VFACHVIGWALVYVRDERMITDILTVIRHAIDRGDEPPLLLLHSIDCNIRSDAGVARGVARLGERALDRGETLALARVTVAFARNDIGPRAVRAPARWIRALVGDATLDDVDFEVLSSVATWLRDDGNDVEGVRDLIPDPATWIARSIDGM
jgi:hypothetical protein